MAPSVRSLRASSTRSYRVALRMLRGAAGLGPMASFRWAAHRLGAGRRSGSADGPTANSSYTWVTADARSTTVVWVHNYWSDAYGITEGLRFRATLLDPGGTAVHVWTFDLAPDATVAVDAREQCLGASVALPFEGQLLLELHHRRLVANRPLQVFADYTSDDGSITGVHGQYGVQTLPAAQEIGEMRLEAGSGTRTAVVVVNAFGGPGGPRDMRTRLKIHDAEGRTLQRPLGKLPHRASRTVWIDEAFPEVATFLGGRPGSITVDVPCPTSRLATFVDFEDGARRVVNHGTVNTRWSQRPGCPAAWTASASVASSFALCDEHRDSVLTLVNRWGPAAAYDAIIRLWGEDGSPLATGRLHLPVDGTASASTRDLLTAAGVALPVVAHAEVTLQPCETHAWVPAVFNVLTGVVDDGRLTGEVLFGATFLNGDVPPGTGAPDVRRTRVFGRVRTGAGQRTRVFLANPSGAPGYDTAADAELTLLDCDAQRRAVHRIRLAAHGCTLIDIEEAFPDVRSIVGDTGVGTLRVRSTDARLIGAHLVEAPGSPTVAVDHLVGG